MQSTIDARVKYQIFKIPNNNHNILRLTDEKWEKKKGKHNWNSFKYCINYIINNKTNRLFFFHMFICGGEKLIAIGIWYNVCWDDDGTVALIASAGILRRITAPSTKHYTTHNMAKRRRHRLLERGITTHGAQRQKWPIERTSQTIYNFSS